MYNLRYSLHLTHPCLLGLLALMSLFFAACNGRKSMLPASGGRPFEVTVVGDVDSVLYKALSMEVDGLPQPEPMFDVSEPNVKPSEALKGVLRYARSLVIVDINPKKYNRLRLEWRRNRYAEPQLIVLVCAPSAQCLCDTTAQGIALQGKATLLAARLKEHEFKAYTELLRHKHNPKMEAEVRRMFGFDLPIPADMTSCKKGKDFIWISNNSPTAMQNICIYKHPFAKRDSVMRVNIKGETDSMYMSTVHDACSVVYGYDEQEDVCTHQWRGLWEMRGDAMGGPLVARSIWGYYPREVVTVEGFVYAPGKKKRNLIMQLEAILQATHKQHAKHGQQPVRHLSGKKHID